MREHFSNDVFALARICLTAAIKDERDILEFLTADRPKPAPRQSAAPVALELAWVNRDHAGRCSASAPTGFASVRLVIFSDATRATAGSMRGITYGLRTTKARCRIRCKIKRNSFHRFFITVPVVMTFS